MMGLDKLARGRDGGGSTSRPLPLINVAHVAKGKQARGSPWAP